MKNDTPVIIEVALNGATNVPRNAHVPLLPEDIASVASACITAGASIIHNHIEDITISGRAAGERYAEGWISVFRNHPEAIVYPTTVVSDDAEARFSHIPLLIERGMATMATLDPGSTSFSFKVENGLPARDHVYKNSYSDIRYGFQFLCDVKIGASMALYDASYARAVLAWYKAGKLPKGSLVKFYFGGDYEFLSGEPGGVSFGLLPTPTALDAYLEMIEGTNLPWSAAVMGGDVVACGLARAAIERGGHLRVGLEDYGGPDTPSNVELVQAAVDVCRRVGRPIATPKQAREILSLPARAG